MGNLMEQHCQGRAVAQLIRALEGCCDGDAICKVVGDIGNDVEVGCGLQVPEERSVSVFNFALGRATIVTFVAAAMTVVVILLWCADSAAPGNRLPRTGVWGATIQQLIITRQIISGGRDWLGCWRVMSVATVRVVVAQAIEMRELGYQEEKEHSAKDLESNLEVRPMIVIVIVPMPVTVPVVVTVIVAAMTVVIVAVVAMVAVAMIVVTMIVATMTVIVSLMTMIVTSVTVIVTPIMPMIVTVVAVVTVRVVVMVPRRRPHG